MKIYVVVNQPCCGHPIEVLGAYHDKDEAEMVADEGNQDPATTHAYVKVYPTLLLGCPSV